MVWTEERLARGDLELSLVPDIGGRMMDVRYRGVSLLFQNPDLLSHLPDLARLSELPGRAQHLSFPLWGGEKTWIAPDSNWPDGAPYATLDSGKYSCQMHNNHAATMHSPICPQSSLQISRLITLAESNSWTIQHQVTNKGSAPRKVGIWSVLMTRTPASYHFRASPGQTPFLVFGNPENSFGYANGIGHIDCNVRQEFKVGIHPNSGVSATRLPTSIGNIWMINRVRQLADSTAYAHGHALEFYNSGHYDYGELEWHSPVALLQPDENLEYELDYHVVLASRNTSVAEMFELFETKKEGEQ